MSCDLLFNSRLVAIVRLERLDGVPQLVRTLLDAGVRCIELTLTNREAPVWVTRLLAEEARFRSGAAMLGIGSVRNLEECQRAIEAGAQFVVTPIVSVPVIQECVRCQVPIAAGACTPTEMATAWDAGANIVKVFPARSLGPSYIRDVLAPMPYLKLMPTGGIDTTNARQYLDAGACSVGVGGNLCRADWMENGNWEAIQHAARAIVQATQSET